MGLMAFLPVLALYVEERFAVTDKQELAFWSALIYGMAPFCAAVAGPVWGALGDQLGKKPMAIRANLAIAATTALMPLADSPSVLLVMRAIQGVLAGYVAPAMALASHGAPREKHGIVIARLQVAMAAGSFLGPLVAAEITHWWGRSSLFWVTSVMTSVAALLLHLNAREDRPAIRPTGRAFVAAMLQSGAALLRNRVFAWLLALVLLLRLGQNMLEPFIALFVRELGPQRLLAASSATPELALDRTVGLAFAVLAVAQWVCTPIWGRLADRFGPLRCLAVLGLCLAAILGGTAMVATIDQFLILRLAAACMMAGSMTLAYAAASKRVEDHSRTLAFSLVQSCMQFGFALGPQLGAFFAALGSAEHVELRHPFVAASALCFVAAIGMFVLRRWHAAGAGRTSR